MPTKPIFWTTFSLLLLSGAASLPAHADIPMPEFSPAEIATDRQNAKLISETSATCLQRTWDIHIQFYKSHGYSKFYGVRRADYRTSDGRKQALLKILPKLAQRVAAGDQAAIKELNMREKELETTACVDLARKCLGEGFKAAGLEDTWTKIDNWVKRLGSDGTPRVDGTDIQKALVALGWKSLYWNPDVSRNEAWDKAEKSHYLPKDGLRWNPVWGGHAEYWSQAKNNRLYYNVPVQDISTLVNFGTKPPADFQAIPFFLGTAHLGYHVFPGFRGKVFEAHSLRELKSIDNMQVGPFNPLNQEMNGVKGGDGSPKWTDSEHYRSGLIVVPPGFLPEKPFAAPPASTSTPPDGAPDFKNPPANPRNDQDRQREYWCRMGYREYCSFSPSPFPFPMPWFR